MNQPLNRLVARPDPQIAAFVTLGSGLVLAVDVPSPVKFLAILMGVAVAVSGGPLTGLILVFATLPLWMLDLRVGNSHWGPLELALVACGATVGVECLRMTVERRSIRVVLGWLPERDVLIIAAILAALSAASLFWVADADLRSDSLRALRRVILEPMLVVPALVYARRAKVDQVLIRWLAIPGVLVALLAVGQVLADRSTVEIGGLSRPIGTFAHPNNLAFYLERVVWFGPLMVIPVFSKSEKLRWVAFGLMIAACLVTLSRGAALALILGGCIYFWEQIRARAKWWPVAAGVVLLFTFGTRYLADNGESVSSREAIWRSSIDMIRDHPVTGDGLDQFFGQYGRRYVELGGWPERYTSHPHNIILDFWLSLGIGGVFLLWMIVESIYRRVRSTLATPQAGLPRAAVAMLVAGLAHGMIDNGFFLPDLATFMWIGLVLTDPTNETPDE